MIKRTFVGTLAAVLMTTGAAAQSSSNDATGDRASAFDGFKIGASIDNRHHEVKRDVPSLAGRIDERSGGVGYRGFAGYDKTIDNVILVGAEAGIGNGGKDVRTTIAGGSYRTDPGWAWDASIRVGVLPTSGLLLYGRTGYGWTRAKETIAPIGTGLPTARTRTDGSLD